MPSAVRLYQVDLRDGQSVADLIAAIRPDLVHHLAAQSSVALSWGDPMGTLLDNATAQHNVLEALVTYQRDARVVVVGSCDEYGNVAPDENPIRETHELRPVNPYALSKVVQDLMGREYAEVHGLAVVRVRPFLQIGPRRQTRFVAGSFACQIAEIERRLRQPVIKVGNIDLLRDFTDVRDMARAYALIADEGEPGEVYNIASGTAHSLRELLQVMLRASGVGAEIRPDPDLQRPGEAPLLVGDASRLRRATGWAPAISFEQSAADTLEYWRQRVEQTLVRQGNGI